MGNSFKSHKKLWISLAVIAFLTVGFCILGSVKVGQELASAPSIPPALWTEVAPLLVNGDQKKAGHLVKAELDIFEAEKCTAAGKHDAAVDKMKSACEEMRECFGTKSICYAIALQELSEKERFAGRSKDSSATMQNCLAALPEDGAESVGNMLREQMADSLSTKFFKNQKEILELRQHNVIAAEKLYKQDRKNSEFFITALSNLSRDQEAADLLADSLTTRVREKKVLQECNLQEGKDYPECLVYLGGIELKNRNYDDAEKYLRDCIDWFKKHPAEAQKPWAAFFYVHAYDALAKTYVRRGKYDEAEKYFRQAIQITFETHNISSPFYQTLGRFFRSREKLKECDSILKEGLAHSQGERGLNGLAGGFGSGLLQDLAISAALRGDRASAEHYFSLWSSSANFNAQSLPPYACIWGADFNELNKRGRRPKSLASLETMVINPTVKHLTYPEYVISRQDFKCLLNGIAVPIECREEIAKPSRWRQEIDIGTSNGAPNLDDASLAALNRALALAHDFHSGDRRISISFASLGLYYFMHRNYEQAESFFEKAVDACEQEPQEYLNQVGLGKVLDQLGRTRHLEKKYDAAATSLLRSMNVLAQELGQDHDAVQISRAEYAANLIAQDKFAEARRIYSQILARDTKYEGGPDFASCGRAKLALAFVCEKEGNFDEASKYCSQLSSIKDLPSDLQYRRAKVSAALLEHNGKTAEASSERGRMQKLKETFGKSDPYLDDW